MTHRAPIRCQLDIGDHNGVNVEGTRYLFGDSYCYGGHSVVLIEVSVFPKNPELPPLRLKSVHTQDCVSGDARMIDTLTARVLETPGVLAVEREGADADDNAAGWKPRAVDDDDDAGADTAEVAFKKVERCEGPKHAEDITDFENRNDLCLHTTSFVPKKSPPMDPDVMAVLVAQRLGLAGGGSFNSVSLLKFFQCLDRIASGGTNDEIVWHHGVAVAAQAAPHFLAADAFDSFPEEFEANLEKPAPERFRLLYS